MPLAAILPKRQNQKHLPHRKPRQLPQILPHQNPPLPSIPKLLKAVKLSNLGSYHLELVSAPENDGIHLDFFLQTGDNHEAIPDANVTAQVQLPDGEQKTLNMEYDVEGKHYAAFLPAQAAGEYKVAVQTDINGEKVNGRFSFSK